ncbi:MAG TPA: tyrosine-type recombinase/integrase [Gammaproteobacteria bacterium]|nr:tyrosine-type recombinase/integrase [Gammaproteobacteria bacterium]
MPLPEPFGQVFGYWLSDKGKIMRPGIDNKAMSHKLRYTYATRLLDAGAEHVDIQALLGHVNLATMQLYTHVSEDRMAGVGAKL